jgi:cell division protein FtsL
MNNLLQKPFIILIATIITSIFVFSLRKTASKSLVSQQNVELLEEKIQDINNQIENEEKELKTTSSEFVKEKAQRNELLRKKAGEYVLQIPLEEDELEANNTISIKKPIEAWKELFTNE